MSSKKDIISAYMAEIGAKGGAVKSERKAAAVAENGKKGGRPRKGISNDFEIDVVKNGKPRKLRLVNDGRKQYSLYIVYPPDQGGQVVEQRARYQPEAGIFPDIKYWAVKNGFEINDTAALANK